MTAGSSKKRRVAGWVSGIGLAAAGAVGGAMLADSVTASADTTTAPSVQGAAAPSGAPDGSMRGGAKPVRGDEKSVSADVEAKLRAAALQAVPGGTVDRIETDAGDGAYEAHMTKADGSRVTVKFNEDLSVTKVEDGMGTGDPAPAGQAPDSRSGTGGQTTGG